MGEPLPLPEPEHKPGSEVAALSYAPSLTVKDTAGNRWEVAINAAANRAQGQIVVSKVRRLYEKALAGYLEDGAEAPDALTLQRLANTALAIEQMGIICYEAKKEMKPGETSEFERLATGLVKAAAEGVGRGAASGAYREQLKRIRNLGRHHPDPKPVEAEIVEMPPPEAPPPE